MKTKSLVALCALSLALSACGGTKNPSSSSAADSKQNSKASGASVTSTVSEPP